MSPASAAAHCSASLTCRKVCYCYHFHRFFELPLSNGNPWKTTLHQRVAESAGTEGSFEVGIIVPLIEELLVRATVCMCSECVFSCTAIFRISMKPSVRPSRLSRSAWSPPLARSLRKVLRESTPNGVSSSVLNCSHAEFRVTSPFSKSRHP